MSKFDELTAMRLAEWAGYMWVPLLAAWGGAVSYLQRKRRSLGWKRFLGELMAEMFVSAFVGVMTYLMCASVGLNDMLVAALVGVSGHMSSKALALMRAQYETALGLDRD